MCTYRAKQRALKGHRGVPMKMEQRCSHQGWRDRGFSPAASRAHAADPPAHVQPQGWREPCLLLEAPSGVPGSSSPRTNTLYCLVWPRMASPAPPQDLCTQRAVGLGAQAEALSQGCLSSPPDLHPLSLCRSHTNPTLPIRTHFPQNSS